MSCGGQGSTVQGSFPHKCNQEVWWDALNVKAATIPPVTSGLTPSLKLFLNNRTSSGNVPLTLSYYPSMWPSWQDNGLLGHGYDTWHMYLIWILVPHNSPSKLWFFSLIRGEKWGFDFGLLIPHVSLTSTCESATLRVLQPFWRFGVRNVSLNVPGGALFPTSYGEMEILWLASLLKF